MAGSDAANRVGLYVERLLENEYVQDNLSAAFGSLRAAYGRASGRKAADAAGDKKLRRQVRQAASSLHEAALALKSGREKPKKRRGPLLLLVLGVGAAVALAGSEDLRARVLGVLGLGDDRDHEAAGSPPDGPTTT